MKKINLKYWDKFVWNKISKKPRKAFYSGPGYEPETLQQIWRNIENPVFDYLQNQKLPAS